MDRDTLLNQRYTVVRPLGEGGMGSVYLVRDNALGGKLVALKLLRPDAVDPGSVSRFKDEFRSMTRLHHPNLAEVYDFETLSGDGRHFLTMEYVAGMDLTGFDWKTLRDRFDDLAVQCLRALDYIHARGLLHNDIKPQNIMVRLPFQAKILDLGLAQSRTDARAAGLSGTVHYLAPERLQGASAEVRSDLYSLGVVLYERLTGTLPFQGEDAGKVISAILKGRARPPRDINDDVPERIQDFVMALLARDAAERPASASAALESLNRGRETPLHLDTPETYASFVSTGRFVGRDAELTTLLDLAMTPVSEAARPRLVLVGGTSGIGKSRLLRELKNRLQLAGARCLTGRCYEDGGVPLQPFLEVLRQIPRGEGLSPEQRTILDQLIPAEAAKGVPPSAALTPIDGGDKATFIAGLAGAIEVLSNQTPGIAFLEDLHWSDAPGVDLLEQILARSRPLGWLLIGSLRDDEVDSAPIGALLRRDRDPSRLRRVTLKPLDSSQIAELLTSMVPFETRPELLAGKLAEQTAGNPLYIEELMRALAEEGTLRRSGGAWIAESRSLEALQLPASLASVVTRRLEGLAPEERRAAEYLAVFNRPVTVPLLARTMGLESAVALEWVEALRRLRLVVVESESSGPPLVDLAHSRIREAIYRGMTDARRRELHLAAGNAIEAAHATNLDAVVEELAHHFTQADDRSRAADYCLRAGDRADALFNFTQQIAYHSRVLDLVPAGDRRRLQAHKSICATMVNDLTDYKAGLQATRLFLEEARKAGDRAYESTALRYQAFATSYLGHGKEAIEIARRGLAVARTAGSQPELVGALNVLTIVLGRAGRQSEALPLCEEARSLSRAIGDFGNLVSASCNEALCYMGLGEMEKGRDLMERATAFAKDKGLSYQYRRNVANLGIVRYETGDLVGALEALEESFAWASELANPEAFGLHLSGLGSLYRLRGLYDRARRFLDVEMTLRRQMRDEVSQLMLFDFIGACHRELGHAALAETTHREGLELARKVGERRQEGHLLASLAADLVGRAPDRADEMGREALAIGREIAHPRITFYALAALARVAIRRGDRKAILARRRTLRGQNARPLRFHDRLELHLLLGEIGVTLERPLEAEREARAGLAADAREEFREHRWKLLMLLGDIQAMKGLPSESTDAYNAAFAIIRKVASEIEDPQMRQDYPQEEQRQEVARKATEAAIPSSETRSAVVPVAEAPVKTLATVYEIAQVVTSILDPKELLNKVMDLALEIVRAERGLIFLYRGDLDEMEMVVARNMEKQTIKDATEYSRSVLREAGRGRSILSHDAVTDSRFKEFRSVNMFHIRSLLCVPLRIKERIIGTVYVDTRQPGVVFTEDDLRFLEAFANQASVAIENARLYDQLRQENQYLKQAVQERYGYENIVGRSAKMREVFAVLSRVAPSNLPVMIRGESGTGKELVARALHHNSSRRDRKFFSENCAALPDTLLESELFGHARGAFTGADSHHKGLFEQADGGTLFMDEVGDMSMAMQSKLLRVLQDGEIRPVGAEQSRRVDVRVISATNRNLEQMIRDKKFREDLYFRLKVLSVKIPALRDRREDLPLLVDHFLGKIARENNAAKLRIDPQLMAVLTRYEWPGNVRELENEVYRLALFASGDTLTLDDARNDAEFFEKVNLPGTRGVDTGVTRLEIEEALSKVKGNRVEAARILGISRATMFRKLRQYDLRPNKKPRPRAARRPPHI